MGDAIASDYSAGATALGTILDRTSKLACASVCVRACGPPQRVLVCFVRKSGCVLEDCETKPFPFGAVFTTEVWRTIDKVGNDRSSRTC